MCIRPGKRATARSGSVRAADSAPALYLLGAETAANLRRYVENGGVLIVTMRSGVKDETNIVVDMPLPGLLAELCGVEVAEYDSPPAEPIHPLTC